MAQALLLFDTYSQLIHAVVELFRQNKNLSPDEAQLLIKDQLVAAKAICLTYAAKDVSLAEFAACAFIDAYALSQKGLNQEAWRKNLLQDEYFNTTDAGVLFFDYCEQLSLEQSDLLHLYFFCLASGFNGRYYTMDARPMLQKTMEALMLKIDQTHQHSAFTTQGFLLGESPILRSFHPSLNKYLWLMLPLLLLMGTYSYFYFSILFIVQSYLTVAS